MRWPMAEDRAEAAEHKLPRCQQVMSDGHEDGCEWGALCEAARQLKGGS